MRLVTFNIHHGTIGRRGPVDARRLAETCRDFEADVLALEEVDRGTDRADRADLAAVVAGACGFDHVFGASHRIPGGTYGNALLVRGRIEASFVKRLPRRPFWRIAQERRTALVAQAVVDDRHLSLVATHLAVPEEINTAQLDRVLKLAQRRTAPTVVLGDFNHELVRVAPRAEAAGFTCVDHGPTIPVDRPRNSIDHVLLSPGFVVRSVEVRPTEMSDHCALIVDVDWPSLTDTNGEAGPVEG